MHESALRDRQHPAIGAAYLAAALVVHAAGVILRDSGIRSFLALQSAYQSGKVII